jgi:hypothetical protein
VSDARSVECPICAKSNKVSGSRNPLKCPVCAARIAASTATPRRPPPPAPPRSRRTRCAPRSPRRSPASARARRRKRRVRALRSIGRRRTRRSRTGRRTCWCGTATRSQSSTPRRVLPRGAGAAGAGAAALLPHTKEEARAAVYRSNARPRWRQGQCELLDLMYHHFLAYGA